MTLGAYAHAKFTGKNEPVEISAAVTEVVSTEYVDRISELDDLASIEPQPETQPQNPWERAYISSYVGNLYTKQFFYKFRDYFGNPLPVPEDYVVVPISACSAIVKRDDEKYYIGCFKV